MRRADAAWAVGEVGHAELGDERRTRRLVRVVTSLARQPTASLPEACEDWAGTKAAYRFFSNPGVSAARIFDAHASSTAARARKHAIVLAVQDTTILNFTTHKGMEGLGPTGRGHTETYGFFVHSCFALTPQGVPLGLVGQHTYVREEGARKMSEHERERTPISQKSSGRWLDMIGLSAKALPSETRVVAIADREADIFEFFACAVANNQDFLVRSAYERATDDGYAWQEVEASPVASKLKVEVPRSGERPARFALLDVRFKSIQLKPPRKRTAESLGVNIILVTESKPPEGEKPVTWKLLTSLPVTTPQDAEQCVKWYSLRWRIERFHYTLKSGCRIEDLQLETRDRMERALAAYSIVAWYLTALTYQARDAPEAPCSVFFEKHEWEALYCFTNGTPKRPTKPPSLREAVRMLGRLGGFLARKGDGEPGIKVLWRGHARLQDIAAVWAEMAGEQGLVGKG